MQDGVLLMGGASFLMLLYEATHAAMERVAGSPARVARAFKGGTMNREPILITGWNGGSAS